MRKGIIYKFTNKLNHKVYIGQTVNEKRRLNEHIKGKNSDYMLIDAAMLKYGFDCFSYEILYEIIIKTKKDRETLNEKEIEYIQKYNTRTPNGYNILKGGHCLSGPDNPMYGKPITEQHRKKLKVSHIGKTNAMKGKHYSDVKKKVMVKKWHKTMKEKYKNGYIPQRKNIVMFKLNKSDYEYISTFPNAKEIERLYGINNKRIHYALKRECPLDDKYFFIYNEDKENEEKLNKICKNKSIHKKEDKMVRVLNLQGIIVKTIKLSEATKEFGRHVSEVCCGKRKSCKGHKFEFC